MPPSNVSPIYAINNFAWKVLQEEAGWSSSNYGGKIPMIPSQQQPEFMQYNKPFIVFGYAAESSPGDMWMIEIEQAVYTIYDTVPGEVNKVIRTLKHAFHRMDESARDINGWIHSESNGLKSNFDGLLFQWTTVPHTAGPGPSEQEGGRVDGLITVRYGFTAALPAVDEYRY